ncbi:hypothetical protein GCM10022221_18050 [Actinocorallia aurea]
MPHWKPSPQSFQAIAAGANVSEGVAGAGVSVVVQAISVAKAMIATVAALTFALPSTVISPFARRPPIVAPSPP